MTQDHRPTKPIRWQVLIRTGIGIGLIGFSVTVFLGLQERVDTVVARVVERLDPEAVIDSTGCEMVQAAGGQQNFSLEANRCLTYSSGSVKFVEGITLKVSERPDRKGLEVTGTEALVNDAENDVTVNGDVHLTVSDGLSVQTGTLNYGTKRGMVTMEDETRNTTLTRSGLEASGRSVLYDRDQSVVNLREAATVRLKDDGARAAVDISSTRATLAHADRYMDFTGGVEVTTGSMILQSESTTAVFGEEETSLQRLELFGNARIYSTEPSSGGFREMHATKMTLGFEETARVLDRASLSEKSTIELFGPRNGPGARIDAETIDLTFSPVGGGLTALVAEGGIYTKFPETTDGPSQEVHALTLTGSGAPKTGLTSLRFDNDVEYRESGITIDTGVASDRVIQAEQLEVNVEEGLTILRDVHFLGNVRLTENGGRQASADEAIYDPAGGLVTLTANSDVARAVRLSDTNDDGSTMEIMTDRMNINLGRMAPEKPPLSAPPLKPLPVPEIIPGPEPAVETVPNTTIPVPDTQPVMDIRAYSIILAGNEVDLDGSAVKASGDIKSVMTPLSSDDQASNQGNRPALLNEEQEIFVTADEVEHYGENGKSTYTGQAHLWQGETSLQGDVLGLDDQTGDLTLDGNVRTIIQLFRLNETTQRNETSLTRGEASQFVYDNATRRATYQNEALLLSNQGDLKADTVEVFLEEDGRTLDRLTATGNVKLRLTGRWALGERLVYYESEGRYEMEGMPVEIVEEIQSEETESVTPVEPGLITPPPPSCRTTRGRTMTFYRSTNTVDVDGNNELRTQTTSGECAPLTF